MMPYLVLALAYFLALINIAFLGLLSYVLVTSVVQYFKS